MDFAEDKHLPVELWTEILARLPVKTLLRFRCVCKTWCSIIDSSDFMSMHLQLYKNNRDKTFVLLQEDRVSRDEDLGYGYGYEIDLGCNFRLLNNYTFDMYDDNLYSTNQLYMYAGDCLGLMLGWQVHGYVYVLWNPSTRNSMILPPNPWNKRVPHGKYLVGFAPSSNDYKVVQFDDIYKDLVFIYSVNDHLWKRKNTNFPVDFKYLIYRCVYVYFQGATYWIGGYLDEPWTQTRVVYFNFDVEEFGFVELPDAGKDKIARVMFILGDSIAVMSICSESTRIWVMEKDRDHKESWRLWFSGAAYLDANQVLESDWWSFLNLEVVYNEKNGTLLFGISDMIYSYDFKNQQLQPITTMRDIPNCFNYVESLVLHKGSQGQTDSPPLASNPEFISLLLLHFVFFISLFSF